MKKVFKILLSVFIVVYAVVAIILTACLLNYNDYKVTVFNKTSLIIVNDDALNGKFKKGSLLITEYKDNINVGDEIIFYNTYNNQVSLSVAEVLDKEQSGDNTIYTLNGNYDVEDENVVGSTKDTKVLPVLGSIMGVLESRIGFLVFIIFPITIAFLYEVCVLILEIKSSDNKKKE